MSSKTDFMYEIEYNPNFSPTRSPKVNIKTMTVNGKCKNIMKNRFTGTYYDLDELSNDTWNLIDGKRTVAGITNEILDKWKDKDEAVDADAVKEVLSFFAESNCLKAVDEPLKKKKRLRVVSAFEIDVTLLENSEAFLRKIHTAIQPLLKSPLLWITLGFVAVNSLAFSSRFASTFADSQSFEILGSTVVGLFFYFFIVLGPVIAIHELAHAIALIHYGGTPGEIGTGLFYFGPMFYVDATDSWTLPKRQRIVVEMAGIVSTLLIGSIIVTWGFFWPFPSLISNLLYMAAFFCFYSTLLNLAPPFETDGYYALTDVLNIPSLREDSYNYLKTTVKKALRRSVETIEGLTERKKKILLGYAILSAVWIVYTAYQTLTFTFYMAEDASVAFLNITFAAFFARTLSLADVAISVAALLYFAMTIIGYGAIFIVAIKKASNRTLRFESIHDRDLSVFLYLPIQVPKSVASNLNENIEKLAKKLSPNYSFKEIGSLRSVVLRMGGTKLAIPQIREHLRNVESAFYFMYRKFLQSHRKEIFESAGIYNQDKSALTNSLHDMANEIATSGVSEAKNVLAQIIERENRATLYLLNSAFGSVWTIEIPPFQQQEVLNSLFPTFFAEDLAITDLYGEVEEFKKSNIFGFDSLAKLGVESRRSLEKALAHPEKYQVFSFFEPVKCRLALIGRTEQIEKDIAMFGSLFVCQVWCGYLDNLLSETNLTFTALGRVPSLEREDVQTLRDGELFVLSRNLSTFVANEKIVAASLKKSEECLFYAVRKVETLRNYLQSNEVFQSGLLNPLLEVNTENLKHLPKRFATFREEFQRYSAHINKTMRMTKREYEKRAPKLAKKKRRMRLMYPLIAIVSAVLAFAGLIVNLGLANTALIATVILLNAVYWLYCYFRWKSCYTIGKYPSSAFTRVQLFLFALGQSVHKFVATSDVLIPTEGELFGTQKKSEKNLQSIKQ